MQNKLSFQSVLTIMYSFVLAVLVVWLFNPFAPVNQLEQLSYVGESAGRMMDRHLEFYAGYEQATPLERDLHTFLFGQREEVEAEAIHAYQEVLRFFADHPEYTTPWAQLNTRTRLFVTLAETGQNTELEQALGAFDKTPEEEVIAEAIRFAYFDTNIPPSMPDIITGASLLPLGWASDRLRLRIAQKINNQRLEQFVEERLQAHGARLRANVLHLTLVVAGLIGLGVFLLFRCQVLTRVTPWSGSILEQPWSFQEGVAVAVRAGVFGILIVIGLQMFASQYFKPGLLALWSTLFASLPMLWLIRQRLLKPRGLGLRSAFNLHLSNIGWRKLLTVSLAFLAIEWFGTVLIGWLGWKLGIGGHWAEGIQERMIFGPTQTIWLSTINIVLWAAIFEELGFRGLVYTTLRSRFNAKLAIIVSAALFSALHLYSLTGFLSIFWSGLVLAYLYERYRSLLPGMLIHGAGNLLNLGTVLLFYREVIPYI